MDMTAMKNIDQEDGYYVPPSFLRLDWKYQLNLLGLWEHQWF